MTAIAFVGLGSNLPLQQLDCKQILIQTIEQLTLQHHTQVVARSSFYVSAPIQSSGPDYVNAVVELSTTLSPQTLLHWLQKIEQMFERERPYKNAPRTLDLDLLLYDNLVLNTPELTLPHPAITQRAFVVKPLFELAPYLELPGHGHIKQWLKHTEHQRATHD